MEHTGGLSRISNLIPISKQQSMNFTDAKKGIYNETETLFKEHLNHRPFNQYEKYGSMFRSIWEEYKKLSVKSMNLYTFIAINKIAKPIQSSQPIKKNEYELSLPAGTHTDWTRPDDEYINTSFQLWLAMIIEKYNTQKQ